MSTAKSKKKKKSSSMQGSIVFILVIGILITLYFLFQLIFFLNRNSVHYAVAEKGTLENSFTVRAVLTREETLVRASSDGIVQYYYAGGQKLAANTRLGVLLDPYYGDLLDKKIEEVYSELEELEAGHAADFAAIEGEMSAELSDYLRSRGSDRSDLYRLKSVLEEDCRYRRELFALSANKRVLALLDAEGIYLKEQEGEQSDLWLRSSGIIEYSYDGYEGWTAEQIGPDFLSRYDGVYSYPEVGMRNRRIGEVLYRVIQSEEWYLTAFVSASQAASLSGRSQLDFFYNGSEKMSGEVVSLTQEGEGYKLVLRLRSRMQAHDTERIAELRFVTGSMSGIKISSDCITEGEYYCLPAGFVVRQGSGRAVLRVGADGSVEAVPVSCIWNDGENYFFSLPEGLHAGDTVMKEGSAETTQIGESRKLSGVYVVNGLSEIFEAVEVLYEDSGYCIVEGISPFDRVKLMD